VQDQENASVNRRRLLRRAGSVAAGVAGAGVITAVAGSPAQAAPGGQVLMAPGNDAGGNNTSITSTNATATLSLANSNADAGGWAYASLQLVPTTPLSDNAPIGSLGADTNGFLWTNVKYSNGSHGAEWVYTTANSNKTVLLDTPQRALNTSTAAGRANIINPGVLDAQGRLIGGQTIELDLDPYAAFADAVLATIAVLAPTSGGYTVVHGLDLPQPETANTGWAAGQTVNTYLACATNFRDGVTTTGLSIFSTSTAYIILDVWGFVVRSAGQVAQAAGAGARAASPQAAEREAFKSREIAKILKNK
jgi:hypothetical protein